MIEGCLDWQENGLLRPESVKEATAAYFDEQDLFGQWIEECCEIGRASWETTARLFESWKNYADRNGEHAGSTKAFSANLAKREFIADRRTVFGSTQRIFRGIAVKIEHDGRLDGLDR